MRTFASLAPIAACAAFAVLATGCASYVPFTYELRSEHRLSDDEVKNLQFYTSDSITLRREVQSEDTTVTAGHRLRLMSGKSVEEVVIPAKTPGVAIRSSSRVLSVSFTNGTSLDFVSGTRTVALGSYGDVLESFAVSEGTYRPHKAVNANFLGQYAEPPPGQGNPVRVVRVAPPPSLPDQTDLPSGSYFLATDSSGRIPFSGLTWDAMGDTMKAHLLIRSDKLEETEERRTVLPGVVLDK